MILQLVANTEQLNNGDIAKVSSILSFRHCHSHTSESLI